MKKLLIPAVLCALLFAACKKKESTISTPINTNNFKTYASMYDVFAELELPYKVVTFDAAAGTSFYGNSGTRYIIKPNSLVDGTGKVVTGNVQATVNEWLKRGDMIFSKMLPMSNGQPLVTGGQLLIQVTQNYDVLYLRPYSQGFQANIPQAKGVDTAMGMFRGGPGQDTATSIVNWRMTEQVDTGINSRAMAFYKDTISIICDSFNYWNSDHFYSYTNLQTFKVNIAAGGKTLTDVKGMYTYALFDTENMLMPLRTATSGVYDVNYLPRMSMHFVSFGLIDGHFYGGVIAATPATSGNTYTITLVEVDPKDFKAQLNGMY